MCFKLFHIKHFLPIKTIKMYLYISGGDIVLLLEIFVGTHFPCDGLRFNLTISFGPECTCKIK